MAAEIPPIEVWVRAEFLHDGDPEYKGLTDRGMIIGIESYVGCYPTFTFLSRCGGLFCDLPPDAFVTCPTLQESPLARRSLAVFACPCRDVDVVRYERLASMPSRVWIDVISAFIPARYHATVYWRDGNRSANIMLLDDGQVAILPNHEMLFGGDAPKLPPWCKQHSDWLFT